MRARAEGSLPRAVTAALAAAFATCVAASHAYAQDTEAQDAPAEAAVPEKPAEGASAARNCGGLPITSTVVSAVRSLFGRSSRSVLSQIRPGPFCASSQAIGLERDIDNRRVDGAGLIHLPEFTDYANAVLERLKEATRLTDIPGAVYVSADTGFEAKSTPDGNIYLSIGAIKTLENEDALAALLAHELAHVVLGHYESDIFVTLQKQLQVVGIQAASLRRTMETLQRSGTANGNLTSRDMQQVKRVQIAIAISDGVLHPMWNRRQELEADKLALDLTQQLGYSYVRGMQTVLSYIEDYEGKRNAAAAQSRQELQDAAQGDLGKHLAADLKQLLEALGRKHDDAAVRRSALDTYYEQTYPDAPPASARASDFDSAKNSPGVTSLLAAYENALRAERMLEEGESRAALAAAEGAAGGRGAASGYAYPLLVLAKALRENRQQARANDLLVRSTRATEPVLKSHVEYASHLHRSGNRDGAYAAIESAFELFRKAPNAYPELIRFYTQFGQQQRAQQLLNECVTTLPAIRETCAFQAKAR